MIITLTPHDVSPRVDIELSALPVGTTTLTITRIADGRTWKVRIAGSILAGSTAYTEDAEAPTGVVVYYRVTALSSTGSVLEEQQVSTGPIADAPHSMVWLSDPLDATSAVLVTLSTPSIRERPRPRQVADSWPIGGDLAHSAWSASTRGPLYFEIHPEEADYDTVMDLLDGPVLIRPPAHYRIGAAVYGIPRDVLPAVDLHPWRAQVSFSIVPSVGPTVSVLLPRRTLGDVEDEGLTLGELEDQYLTLGEMEVGH